MMQIVHVMQSFQVGGLEKMVVHLAIGARARGHQVDVVASHEDGPLREHLEAAGISTHLLGASAGLTPRTSLRLAAVLRQVQATHMHTHHLGPFLYGTAARCVVGRGITHIHTEHSHEFYDCRRRRAAGRAMEHLADVVACSSEVADFRRAVLGASSVVIDNGVPGAAATPDARAAARMALGMAMGAPLVMAVGRLAPEKDHVRLVRAFGPVAAALPTARLVIVGEGRCRADIEHAIAVASLGQRVTLLGARHDVASLLPAADVLAFSSAREALPLALLEGLAAQVPFVGTAVGELPALADAGVGLVAVDDIGLADALRRVLTDGPLRDTLARAGHALWRRRFSVDVMIDRYLARYVAQAARTALRRTA